MLDSHIILLLIISKGKYIYSFIYVLIILKIDSAMLISSFIHPWEKPYLYTRKVIKEDPYI